MEALLYGRVSSFSFPFLALTVGIKSMGCRNHSSDGGGGQWGKRLSQPRMTDYLHSLLFSEISMEMT